mgnify:CR=1 FL=1
MGALPITQSTETGGKGLDINAVDAQLKRILSTCNYKNSLTSSVLAFVINYAYDHAANEIDAYITLKKEYPAFVDISRRYVEKSKELIGIVRQERSVPGFKNMSIAKRKAISDEIARNFEQLKDNLRKVEQLAYNNRVMDLRSTLILVKTLAWCIFTVAVVAFMIDFNGGLYETSVTVFNDLITSAVKWTVDKTGI